MDDLGIISRRVIGDRRFRVTGPAVINVSGGRTSGFMLRQIIDAWDGQLPADVIPVFANTGREMPATLDFVRDMAARWGTYIQWLEYRRDPETGRTWSEPVNHNSASRHGEPFEMLVRERQILPNPVTRFCTTELKIRTMRRWLRAEFGWSRWISVVGLRADEMHRVVRAGIRNSAKAKKEKFRVSCPLARARLTKADVMAFWAAQPFDLQLAGAWEGNCDGCLFKSRAALHRMLQDHPERMTWWAEMEGDRGRELGVALGTIDTTTALFRNDRESYAAMTEHVRRSPRLPGLDLDPGDSVFDVIADCEGGCGV